MANRDVGVSICGVVVGVMLGAGSVLYAQDISLSASSTEIAFRGQDIKGTEAFKARHVDERARDAVRNSNLQSAPRLIRDDGSDDVKTAAPIDTSACAVATRILDRMLLAINSTIPREQTDGFEMIRNTLGDVVANTRNDYCGAAGIEQVEEMRSDTKTDAETQPFDNNCAQYKGSPRQKSRCEASDVKGMQYRGR